MPLPKNWPTATCTAKAGTTTKVKARNVRPQAIAIHLLSTIQACRHTKPGSDAEPGFVCRQACHNSKLVALRGRIASLR